jgi:hypothetical protein
LALNWDNSRHAEWRRPTDVIRASAHRLGLLFVIVGHVLQRVDQLFYENNDFPPMAIHKKILEWQAAHPNITWIGWGVVWVIVLAILFWPRRSG